MIIRETYNSGNEIELSYGSIDVIADDGRVMLSIEIKDNGIEVISSNTCKHKGVVLDNKPTIIPIARNVIKIELPEYKK